MSHAKSGLPISIDREHRKVIDTVQDAVQAVRYYRTTHRDDGDGFSAEQCLQFIAEFEKMDLASMEIDQVDRLPNVVDKRARKRDEIVFIRSLKRRYIDFCEVLYACKRLRRCMHRHLFKYCLSLHGVLDMEEKVDLPAKYEEKVKKWRSEIDEYSTKSREASIEYRAKTTTVGEWLREFGAVRTASEEVCDSILKTAEIVREYIRADQQYPNELYNAIIKRSHERGQKEKRRQKIAKSKDSCHIDVERKRKEQESCLHHLKQLKIQSKHVSSSREILKLKTERAHEDVKVKAKELDESENLRNKLESKVKPKDYNEEATLRLYKQYKNQTIDCRLAYDKSLSYYKACQRQMTRLDKQEQDLKNQIYEAEMELEDSEQQYKSAVELIDSNRIEDDKLVERIDVLNQEMEFLQMVRELKLSPDTLRRIHKTGDPKPKTRPQEFNNACKLVSDHIGDEWPRLYVQLPFKPRRELCRRRQDVQTVDAIYGSPRFDLTCEGRAEQSLLKWKQFNPRGTVVDLIKSLRKIEKQELATSVENLCGLTPRD